MTEQTEGAEVVRPLTDEQRRYLWDGIEAAGVAGLVDTLVRTEVAAAEARGAERALREAADEGPLHFAATHRSRDARGWNVVEADWLRARAAAAAAGGGA